MDDDGRQQKVFGPRVFCFGWYDHGRLGTDPTGRPQSASSSSPSSTSPPESPSLSKRALSLRQSKKKKLPKVKPPTYSNKPVPVSTLVGSQTQGIVAEVATGERHTLVITTRGQVLAFGDNTKYALGSKNLFQ